MAVAVLMLIISESCGPLRELALGANRFRDSEVASLLAAVREQNAQLENGDETHVPLVLDFALRDDEVDQLNLKA